MTTIAEIITRLAGGWYNSRPYSSSTNPGGLAERHDITFPAALADTGAVAQHVGALAGQAVEAAAQVAADKATVTEAAATVTTKAGEAADAARAAQEAAANAATATAGKADGDLGNVTNAVFAAKATAAGVGGLTAATQAEVDAGTSATKAVTPQALATRLDQPASVYAAVKSIIRSSGVIMRTADDAAHTITLSSGGDWSVSAFDAWLTYGMVCFLDFGQSACYPGSGSSVYNLVPAPADGSAREAYNFSINNSLAFSGLAGGRGSNQYLAANGSGYLTATANTTFTNSLHKAGAAFTLEFVTTNVANYAPLFATTSTSTPGQPGVAYAYTNAPAFTYIVSNESAQVIGGALASGSAAAAATGGVAHTVLSIAHGGSSFLMINGVVVATFTPSSASLSTAAAGLTPRLLGGTGHTQPSGRLHAFVLRNIALTQAQASAQFAGIRNRWGL